MEVTVKGKQMDVGDALRTHVSEQLTAAVSKYFENALDSNVVFSKQGHGFHVDLSVHAGRGMIVQGSGSAADAYAAFDSALERIAKQLRRYKRRLKDHHHKKPTDDQLPANYSVIASENDDELPEESNPAIIAEMPTGIATLSVSEAVMRMDLANAPVMMFRNPTHGGLNVVYRRADGNVGWIDPASNTTSAAE